MAYDYKDMSVDDLAQIVSNKRKSQNIYAGTQKWDSPDQLKLKESNGALRNKYGIVGDDLNLQAAEALLKQKQDASKPINQTGLPTKQTTVYETPFTNPLIAGVQGRQDILFGDGMKNVMDNPAISAIRGENEKAGENAYNSAIGNMTEFTGGRLNSWAAKAASDSKQAYADKGDADVANYVQMMLNGQKSFTDDAFNYDTGFYNRDYQERQTPILNAQTDRQLGIDEKLANAKVTSSNKSSSSGGVTATNRAMDDYYNGLVAENANTDGESLYANLANNQEAYIQNMGPENFSKAVKYSRDKYLQTVINRWRGNEGALTEELKKKPEYYQNVLGIENYNKLLNNTKTDSTW
jgi:hypothetical protein